MNRSDSEAAIQYRVREETRTDCDIVTILFLGVVCIVVLLLLLGYIYNFVDILKLATKI